MYPPSQAAYDRAITVFSPDGRLFQVEYAREAVKRGTTTVGVKFRDGVVLIVDKRITSRLVEPSSIEKIFMLDDHIGFGTALLVAGVDEGEPHLYETDPSGALMEYKASSVGSGRNQAMEVFEEKFRDGTGQDDAVTLGLQALYKAT